MDDADFATFARSFGYRSGTIPKGAQSGRAHLARDQRGAGRGAPGFGTCRGVYGRRAARCGRARAAAGSAARRARSAAESCATTPSTCSRTTRATARRFALAAAAEVSAGDGPAVARGAAGAVGGAHAERLLLRASASACRTTGSRSRSAPVSSSPRGCRTIRAFDDRTDRRADRLGGRRTRRDHRDLLRPAQRGARLSRPARRDRRSAARASLEFGTIEVYDAKTLQAGNDALARRMPARVVRVQAIGKVEQDKLRAEEIVARFLLGVRERNVRVVYLRPFTHPWGKRSIEAANVAIVARIANGLRANHFQIGRPVGITRMAFSPYEIAVVSLAVPAIVLLILSRARLREPGVAAGTGARRSRRRRRRLRRCTTICSCVRRSGFAAGVAFPTRGAAGDRRGRFAVTIRASFGPSPSRTPTCAGSLRCSSRRSSRSAARWSSSVS